MDAITDPSVERVTVMKAARVGYTKIINNTIAYYVAEDPCPILVVQPTVNDAQDYSKEEIASMIADTPILRELFPSPKAKDSGNTIEKKVFPGGSLRLIGANSATGFRRISIRVLIFDETDGYPPTAGSEGDQIKLGEQRTLWFPDRKIIAGSTPTEKGNSKIEKLFAKSDQRYYFVPCPHCEKFQVLKFSDTQYSGEISSSIKYAFMSWDKDADGKPLPETAHFTCCHCGCVIEEKDKRWMLDRGEWRATKPFTGHAGFHIWAAYSVSPNATWAQLVSEFLDCKNNPEELQTFVNTVLGEVWEEQGEKVSEHVLLSRREEYAAEVPAGALVLTAAVDVQGDRLEMEVVGWGMYEESWGIARKVIYGDPTQQQVWEELDKELLRTYRHESGTDLTISAVGIDTRYQTDYVYSFVRPRMSRRIYALMGVGRPGYPIAGSPQQKKTGRNRRPVPIWLVGTFQAKGLIYSRLKVTNPGAGYCHFPMWYDEEYFAQVTAEKMVTRYKKGFAHKEWVQIRSRNEALDIRVYNLAVLRILNPDYRALAVYLGQSTDPLPPRRGGRRVISRGISG